MRDYIQIQELTINKLKTGLVGRESESQIKRDCVDRITAPSIKQSPETDGDDSNAPADPNAGADPETCQWFCWCCRPC